MPKLPPVRVRDFIRFLEQRGFIKDRQTGSHIVLKKPGVAYSIVIPDHQTEVPVGIVLKSLKHAGIGRDEFVDAMQNRGRVKRKK